ncbi:D-alanine-D-alanine ligase [Marinitoga hydrogenitolerans DSM 16785]|uniref:D-alanine--D-alanine ligase n=1 Tax=Marinitoga hydrogenitolerans (strain DSM 16785 / JCM 12826 / AT1271) TaxID=1122195 RepID=A0A1M4S9K0_MARH1|nr:D-alanine--D-alanine ligase [Marinitoga hydrogenitolerans]SHE28727.1 D-alanine-D-alanine ligase [Marinitoga hydrogenitolerans DSM 16785]
MKYNIALIYGGNSNEREISKLSAKNVEKALKKLNYAVLKYDLKNEFDKFLAIYQKIDLVFNVVHGFEGEDGTLQKKLEELNIKYVGSNSIVSKNTFDKLTFIKNIEDNFYVPKYYSTTKYINPPFSFPLIIKPRKSGSSLGIHICHNLDEYKKHLNEELKTYGEIIIQEFINGREISVSIIEINKKIIVLPILEIKPKKEFYDFEAKYTEGMTDFEVPAKINKKLENKIIMDFKKIFKTIGLKDFARIDAIIKDNKYYILEANTIPGLTKLSDLPQSAKAYGLSFERLIDILIKNNLG